MNKKLLTIGIIVIVLLAAGVTTAIFFLYGNRASSGEQKLSSILKNDSKYSLLCAIPSDAVALVKTEKLQTLVDVVSSHEYKAGVKKTNYCDNFYALLSGYPSLGDSPAAVSLHTGSTVCPLLVVDAGRSGEPISDQASEFIAAAKRQGLYAEFYDCGGKCSSELMLSRRAIVLVSPQENLIKASLRHIIVGESIASQEGFLSLAASIQKDNWIIINNGAMGKLLKNVLPSRLNSEIEFFKKAATWTGFTLSKTSDRTILGGGMSFTKGRNTEYFNIFESMAPAQGFKAFAAIPANATLSYGIGAKTALEYVREYSDWLDFKGYAKGCNEAQTAFRTRTGLSCMNVASALGISEVAYAQTSNARVVIYPLENAPDAKILGQAKIEEGKVCEFPLKGLGRCIFGRGFALQQRERDEIYTEGETHFVYLNDCLIVSDKNNIERFVASLEANGSLLDNFAPAASMRSAHYWAYRSPRSGEGLIISDSKVGNRLAGEYSGVQAAPLAQSAQSASAAQGGQPASPASAAQPTPADQSAKPAAKQEAKASKGKKAAKNVQKPQVSVPAGPWKVKNCGTGKTNTLSQNPSTNEISLVDETGKTLWTVSLPGKIAGRVGQVDHYRNGKIQFLFCIGSKLYLYDRLGRPVDGFPVDLGSNVVLGPDVYDFNKTKKYHFLALMEDGSLQMFNLKGEKPTKWKGICISDDGISSLPVETLKEGKTTWEVPSFSGKIYKFNFYGEPVE